MATISLPPIVLVNNKPLPAVYSVEIESPASYDGQATVRIETMPPPEPRKAEPEFAPMLRALADHFAEQGDQEGQRRLMLLATEGPRERSASDLVSVVDGMAPLGYSGNKTSDQCRMMLHGHLVAMPAVVVVEQPTT